MSKTKHLERNRTNPRMRTLAEQEKKLFSSIGFFGASNDGFSNFSTYKEFLRHQAKPVVNYNSDVIKDILNAKSDMYRSPNAKPSVMPKEKLDTSFLTGGGHPTLLGKVDPSQLRVKMGSMKYP